MINWKDKVPGVSEGTPLNRALLMAMQGMENFNLVEDADGNLTITYPGQGVLTVVFSADGTSAVQTFTGTDGDTITQTVLFGDGSITGGVS